MEFFTNFGAKKPALTASCPSDTIPTISVPWDNCVPDGALFFVSGGQPTG